MLAYCGRPSSAAFCDPFPYIVPRHARETIAETCSIWVALATAIMSQPGSSGRKRVYDAYFSVRARNMDCVGHVLARRRRAYAGAGTYGDRAPGRLLAALGNAEGARISTR